MFIEMILCGRNEILTRVRLSMCEYLIRYFATFVVEKNYPDPSHPPQSTLVIIRTLKLPSDRPVWVTLASHLDQQDISRWSQCHCPRAAWGCAHMGAHIGSAHVTLWNKVHLCLAFTSVGLSVWYSR